MAVEGEVNMAQSLCRFLLRNTAVEDRDKYNYSTYTKTYAQNTKYTVRERQRERLTEDTQTN